MSKPSNKLIETKDLVFVWKLISKNLGLLVIIPLIAYAIGFVYTYRLTETYASRTELLLKSNETYDYQDPIYKGLGAYGVYMDVLNQIKILTSRDLLSEVIDKIDVNTSYYIVGRLKKHEVYKTLPFISEVNVYNTKAYEIPIQVEVLNLNEYELTYEIEGTQKKARYFFDQELITPEFSLVLKRRYTYNETNIDVIMGSDYEMVFHSKDYLIAKYQRSLTVENEEFTSVLSVQVTDELEYRAKTFLDTLNSVFVGFSMQSQLEVNENTLNNIERQIDTVSLFIKAKEDELLLFKDENSILHLTKEEDDFFLKYVDFQKQKRDLEHYKSSIYDMEEYVRTSSDEHLLPPASVLLEKDVYLQKTVEQIYTLQLDLLNRGISQSSSNSHITAQREKIAQLKKDVLIYLRNLKANYESQIKIVDKEIVYYRENIRRLPRTSQGIENIQRELEVNNKMYLFLLEKKTNTLIARAGIIPQVRVIESPRSLGVIAPDRTKLIRLFVLAGFIVTLIVAAIKHIFFERIETVKELASMTRTTVVGGVPYVSEELQSQIIVENQPKSQVTESFRTIRTNLSYLGEAKGRAKKLLVSSYYPGEGKTFCSTNIATLLSKGDKKVLVLDFDLHKPKIHKVFGLSNTKGISTYLIGKNTLDEVVNKDVYPLLDILTAGPVPPNPSELILKEKVSELFKWAEENYDFIVVDTPPFGLLNDALVLLNRVDVLFVILNPRLARRGGIGYIDELFEKYDHLSKGFILNGIKQTKFQYYYSKYTYKYGYRYGKYGYGYGSYGEGYGSYGRDSD